MEANLIFRKLQPGEEESACNMVNECFNEFVAPGYSEEGITEFRNYVRSDLLKERLKIPGNYMLLAIDINIIVGVIEIRSNNHISLLFVRKEYHKKGIARALLNMAVETCKKAAPDKKIIEVNSSPYAVTIYERMGFKPTDSEQVINGIRFKPMELSLIN